MLPNFANYSVTCVTRGHVHHLFRMIRIQAHQHMNIRILSISEHIIVDWLKSITYVEIFHLQFVSTNYRLEIVPISSSGL